MARSTCIGKAPPSSRVHTSTQKGIFQLGCSLFRKAKLYSSHSGEGKLRQRVLSTLRETEQVWILRFTSPDFKIYKSHFQLCDSASFQHLVRLLCVPSTQLLLWDIKKLIALLRRTKNSVITLRPFTNCKAPKVPK